MARIVFATPPYHCGVVEVAGRWLPLAFAYLARASREAGVEAYVVDGMSKMVSQRKIVQEVVRLSPDYVGITAITASLPDSLALAEAIKAKCPKTRIILGGVHPSFLPEEALISPAVDVVVCGEGEETLKELLTAWEKHQDLATIPGLAYRENGTIIKTPFRPFLKDLESYPPLGDIFDWSLYHYFVIPHSRLGAISSSRGCSHECTFCSQQKFWQQSWRGRSPEKVVEEIVHLHKTYGVNVILFTDEYPTKDRDRFQELCERLIGKALPIYILMETRVDDIVRDKDLLPLYKKAGIIHVYVGVEAVRQDLLDAMGKDTQVAMGKEALDLLRAHGFISETSFILGFPDETRESVERTKRLARYYNPDFAHFLMITPWPYAPIYQELKPYIVEKDYRHYNLIDPVIKPKALSLRALVQLLVGCYKDFYMAKARELMEERDPFKRDYMKRSMKLIMGSSFIVKKLGSLKSVGNLKQAMPF